ncbi:helix-turn-helix transcriptional regulator [Ursidibacter sp. B-7004-1]
METNQTTLTAENAPIEKRFTLKEIRALTGTSHAFIYAEIKKGKLAPPEKWGRSSRWKESDVKAWLDTYSSNRAN